MATIRAYTTIEQSRKLAEILPIESADMAYYFMKDSGHLVNPSPFILDGTEVREGGMFTYLNCWSLAALLNVLPVLERKGYQKAKPRLLYNVAINKWIVDSHVYTTDAYDNPIDACVAMIEKLHELKML